MSVDPITFRELLGSFATGVTILTAHDAKGARRGMTASAVSSVSLIPPLVSCCVGHSANFHSAMDECRHFGINILKEDQRDLSVRFASQDVDDKFDELAVEVGLHGVPLLRGAIASMVCEHHSRFEAGDHTVFIGRVLAGVSEPGKPLIYFRSDYTGIQADQSSAGG